MAGINFNPAGVTANLPSWDNSIKWNSPAGGGGFGGGVSPGSSFEPSPGFPSVGDSGFWKNQPTDENYYNKGKSFLDTFAKGLQSTGKDKYQQQATQGGFQTGGSDKSPGANVGQIGPDAFIYTPPTAYSPFTVQGVQGKKGIGGAIANIAGAALAPFTGGASIPIAGAVGGLFD
jgi:hypothetical protein